MVDADLAVMEHMATLRASRGCPTPDAIHLMTALAQKAPVFLTNDLCLERDDTLQVLNLQTVVWL